MKSSPAYRADIDGLRAVAVLSVVAFHVVPSAVPGGFLGVDIFFVISGYLISLILFREQVDGGLGFRAFYARRIRRLFPALFVVLLATLIFGAFALFADEYERVGWHAFYAIVFLLNFRLMGEAGYFDVASSAKPLLHLWSLSVEEQFYLVWPILLVGVRRIRAHMGLALLLLGVGSFAFAVELGQRSPDTLYYHPLARAWELLIGVALAWGHSKNGVSALPALLDSKSARNALSLAGAALVGWALFGMGEGTGYPGPKLLAPLAGVGAVIASGRGAAVNRILATRPLVLVGLISYPLYLWHWPLLSYVRIAESGTPPTWLLWAAAAVAVLLAWATFVLIERPIRYRGGRIAAPVLIASMCALMIAARVVTTADGFPERPAVRYVKDAEAQMKREPSQDASCVALFRAVETPVYCRQRIAGDRMIAIVGDSHAHVLFPGVSELAAERGYGTLLLANSGCPPFDGAVTGRNAREKRECARSIDVILGALERDSRVVAVVLVSRGPQYLDGRGFGPAEANYNYPPISARRGIDTGEDVAPLEVFSRGLQATIARLSSRGVRIAYFLQVPELGVPARDCLMRPFVLTDRRAGCVVPYEVYRTRMADYRALIERVGTVDRSLTVIDAEPYFCGEGHCSGYRDGTLMYADDNHLSALGSRRIAPLIVAGLGLCDRGSPC